MKDLVNKLLLYVICSYLLCQTGFTPLETAAVTVALSGSCLCTYFGDTKITYLLIGSYCVLCLRHPEFGFYLPLLVYDAFRCSRIISLPPILVTGFIVGARLPVSLLFPWLFTAVVSVFLSFLCERIDFLLLQLHKITDESKETTLALRERNRALIEKQDSEIHVATLSERNRIAREIHDNVGHMLTRSLLQTGAIKIINKDPALEESLSTLHDTLNTAMTSIRTSVHDLHDDAIDLSCALTDIISPIDKPAIRLEYDMEAPAPREIKYAFIAIVKEAVNNIQKHSNATSASITVWEHPGFYRLQIQDNGTGKIRTPNPGIGLSNMEERVTSLGGRIRFTTENGFGILITIDRKGGQNESIDC